MAADCGCHAPEVFGHDRGCQARYPGAPAATDPLAGWKVRSPVCAPVGGEHELCRGVAFNGREDVPCCCTCHVPQRPRRPNCRCPVVMTPDERYGPSFDPDGPGYEALTRDAGGEVWPSDDRPLKATRTVYRLSR